MSNEAERKVATWLKSELCKDKPPAKIVLRSAGVGNKGTEVDSWSVEVRIELEEIPALANTIVSRAQEDADGNGPTITRYVVLAYDKGQSKDKARSRFAMRLRGEADLDLDDDSGEEPATMKGLLSQLMRHNEAMARTLVAVSSSSSMSMVRRLESSDKQVDSLIAERMAYFEEREKSRSEEHARDQEAFLVGKEQERKDAMFQKLMGLVPIVVNRIAGQKALPSGDDPMMSMLEALVGTMDASQFQAIAGNLKPEQQLTFFEILRTFQARKAASQPKEN